MFPSISVVVVDVHVLVGFIDVDDEVQTGTGWYLTPWVFACGFGTHGGAAKRKRNEDKPKKANLVFLHNRQHE